MKKGVCRLEVFIPNIVRYICIQRLRFSIFTFVIIMSDKERKGDSTNTAHSPIPVVFENHESTSFPKDDIMRMLNDLENNVEMIRKKALQIEEQRDAMFTALYAFKHSRMVEDLSDLDRDDVDTYMDRICNRCSTIEVTVRTIRDKPQEEALHQINGIIDSLIAEMQNDPSASKEKCMSFMNSCSSYIEKGMEDRIFEQALLGCTLDDQKRVRRRLQGLMSYIEKLSLSS